MKIEKGRIVETTFHEKILRILKQYFYLNLTTSKRLEIHGGRNRKFR